MALKRLVAVHLIIPARLRAALRRAAATERRTMTAIIIAALEARGIK